MIDFFPRIISPSQHELEIVLLDVPENETKFHNRNCPFDGTHLIFVHFYNIESDFSSKRLLWIIRYVNKEWNQLDTLKAGHMTVFWSDKHLRTVFIFLIKESGHSRASDASRITDWFDEFSRFLEHMTKYIKKIEAEIIRHQS